MPGVPKPFALAETGGMFWVIFASSSRERSTAASRAFGASEGNCRTLSTKPSRPVIERETVITGTVYPTAGPGRRAATWPRGRLRTAPQPALERLRRVQHAMAGDGRAEIVVDLLLRVAGG